MQVSPREPSGPSRGVQGRPCARWRPLMLPAAVMLQAVVGAVRPQLRRGRVRRLRLRDQCTPLSPPPPPPAPGFAVVALLRWSWKLASGAQSRPVSPGDRALACWAGAGAGADRAAGQRGRHKVRAPRQRRRPARQRAGLHRGEGREVVRHVRAALTCAPATHSTSALALDVRHGVAAFRCNGCCCCVSSVRPWRACIRRKCW